MTHRERAVVATAAILCGDFGDVPAETFVADVVWRACVEGCNDEARWKREEEQLKLRAMRLQAALEERNARLEGWLEELTVLLASDTGTPMDDLELALGVLAEFNCEDGTV
jgi:hypothetical protein